MMTPFYAALFATVVVVLVRAGCILASGFIARRVQRERDAVQASIFYSGLLEWVRDWHLVSWGEMTLRILQGIRQGTLPATADVRSSYLTGISPDRREYWSKVLEGVEKEAVVIDLTVFEKS